MPTGSWPPARTPRPSTGWSRYPGRTRASTPLAYVEATREQTARRTGLVWCIADSDTDHCLGSLSLEGLGGYSRRTEIGYWAHPAARGRGVVAAAVRVVTAYAEQHLSDAIVIHCAAGNLASRRVAEAAGYRRAGVLAACEPLGDGTRDDLVIYTRP